MSDAVSDGWRAEMRGARARSAWPALAALCAACASCGGAPPRDAPNVVLVSIDSLRADHVHAYGYPRQTTPFLDALAAEGVRFENAVSTTSWTLPSHAAMFTGLYDSSHGLVDNGLSLSDRHTTLAEILRARGYHTAGFFGGPYLHPEFGVSQGFDVYESCMGTTPDDATGEEVRASAMAPRGAPSHADVTGPRTRERVRAWASGRAREPYFLFVHLWDVHYDFLPPEAFASMFTDPGYDGPADGRLMDNPAIARDMAPEDLAHVKGLYDAEIRFTDGVLRGIVGDLRAAGLLENTLVIVTADHGEEFFEHGRKGHNKTLFEEVLRVPLVVHWAGELEGGRVVEDQVQIVDLLPTIAAAAGHDGALAVQGRDLGPLLRGGDLPPRDALAELLIDRASQRALRSNERKLLQVRSGLPVLYIDLRSNPLEDPARFVGPRSPGRQAERRAGERDFAAFMQRKESFDAALGDREPNAIEVSAALVAELEALGYLDDGTPAGTGD